MLIYLATYPRCGSAMLRNMIALNYRLLCANGYPSNDIFPDVWEVKDHQDFPNLLQYKHPYLKHWMTLLPSGCLKILTPELRQRLAALSEPILLKTHELPVDEFFEGERVIQVVRHPCASVVSLWKLMNQGFRDYSLDEVTIGETEHGTWKNYHKAWLNANVPTLRMHYEDLVSDYDGGIEEIGDFLWLRRPDYLRVETLEDARKRNPARNPGSGLDGWREQASPAEAEKIWAVNEPLATNLGYDFNSSSVQRVPDNRSFKKYFRPAVRQGAPKTKADQVVEKSATLDVQLSPTATMTEDTNPSKEARIISFSVEDGDGRPRAEFESDEAFFVRFAFDVLDDGLGIEPALAVTQNRGTVFTVAFTPSVPNELKELRRGRYWLKVCVPENLLNTGIFQIVGSLSRPHPVKRFARTEIPPQIQIRDPKDKSRGALGNWQTPFPGGVRPRLDWSVVSIEQAAD